MTAPSALISLKNRLTFPLLTSEPNSKVTYKGMSYDRFFLIFGNNDIRLKIPEREVFSNLSSSGSHFSCEGCPVDSLLGAGGHR